MELIDNFLDEEYFKTIEDLLFGGDLPYYYNSGLNSKQKNLDDYYFTHVIYHSDRSNSNLFDILKPMLDKIVYEKILKMKVNFFPRSPKIIEHAKHIDLNFKHKGFILYMNNSVGYTLLENNQKVKSVRNRALFFDSSKPHSSTTATNVHGRVNINMNYL